MALTPTSPRADFGVCLAETDIDRLVIDTLSTWLPTYITQAENERQLRHHSIARPRPESYQNALEDTDFPEGRLPAIVVTTAQTDSVTRYADGAYAADFQVVVSAIVRGRTVFETRDIAGIFGTCVRRVLVQQQLDLESELHLQGHSITPLPDTTDGGRWLAASLNRFMVGVDQILTGDGPIVPDADDPPYPPPDPNDPDAPYGNLATVTDVQTLITGLPPTRSS